MKRIAFILLAVVYGHTFAQQPAICGDWTGIYESSVISDDVDEDGEKYFVTKDFKRIIRIKQTEGQYSVRMKIQRADGSGSASYVPNAQIISASDTQISWLHDRGPGDNTNAHYYLYCSVVLTNGVLKYSEYWIAEYPGGGRKKWGELSNQNLYKDEEDW